MNDITKKEISKEPKKYQTGNIAGGKMLNTKGDFLIIPGVVNHLNFLHDIFHIFLRK